MTGSSPFLPLHAYTNVLSIFWRHPFQLHRHACACLGLSVFGSFVLHLFFVLIMKTDLCIIFGRVEPFSVLSSHQAGCFQLFTVDMSGPPSCLVHYSIDIVYSGYIDWLCLEFHHLWNTASQEFAVWFCHRISFHYLYELSTPFSSTLCLLVNVEKVFFLFNATFSGIHYRFDFVKAVKPSYYLSDFHDWHLRFLTDMSTLTTAPLAFDLCYVEVLRKLCWINKQMH